MKTYLNFKCHIQLDLRKSMYSQSVGNILFEHSTHCIVVSHGSEAWHVLQYWVILVAALYVCHSKLKIKIISFMINCLLWHIVKSLFSPIGWVSRASMINHEIFNLHWKDVKVEMSAPGQSSHPVFILHAWQPSPQPKFED